MIKRYLVNMQENISIKNHHIKCHKSFKNEIVALDSINNFTKKNMSRDDIVTNPDKTGQRTFDTENPTPEIPNFPGKDRLIEIIERGLRAAQKAFSFAIRGRTGGTFFISDVGPETPDLKACDLRQLTWVQERQEDPQARLLQNVLNGAEIQKIESFNASAHLSVTPPTRLIGENCWRVETSDGPYWIGTIFNPGQTTDVIHLGAGISQLCEAANLIQDPTFDPLDENSVTPMTERITELKITQSQKTPGELPFFITLAEKDLIGSKKCHIENGEIIYMEDEESPGITIMSTDIEMQRMPYQQLLPKRPRMADIRRRRKPIDPQFEETPIAHPSEIIPTPGFGPDLALTDLQTNQAQTKLSAKMQLKPELSAGHFEGAEIVPVHITAAPVFQACEYLYRKKHPDKTYTAVSQIRKMTVPLPLSYDDNLHIAVQELDDGEYAVQVFYWNNDSNLWEMAVSFGNITVSAADHQKNSWADSEAAKLFYYQLAIPEYQEYLKDVAKEVTAAVAEIPKIEKVVDIGCGTRANCMNMVIGSLDQAGNTGPLNVLLTDVDSDDEKSIPEQALENLCLDLRKQGVKTATHFQTAVSDSGSGEIIPAALLDEPKIDLGISNLVFNYGDTEAEIAKLSSIIAPDGQVILGLTVEHPLYYKLMRKIAERVEASGNYEDYDIIQGMKYVGSLMHNHSIKGISTSAQFLPTAQVTQWLEAAGFEIQSVVEETFDGLACIIRAKKLKK